MRRLLTFTIFALLLSLAVAGTASATTYYIAASGSDSNNGTAKTTPWAHAPGMGGCSSVCGSTTPKAGDSFIFKGGDTWHFGSGTAPSVSCSGGTCWNWTWNGNSGSPIYIGTDHTWFTGGSYARPILNGDDTITTNTVGSCNYDYFNDIVVNTADYMTFDDFEVKGFCYDGQSNNAGGFIEPNGNNIVIEHFYIHGITTQPGSSYNWYAIDGNSNEYGAAGDQCLYNVIDNSDGTWGNYQSFPVGAASLGGIENGCGGVIGYNVFRRISNIIVGTVVNLHDNLFYDDYDPDLAPAFNQNGTHGNIDNSNNNDGMPTPPLRWYNNMAVNVREGVGFWPMLTSTPTPLAYIFNNVIWNCYQQCWFLASNSGAQLYFYNNTSFEGTNSDGSIGADSGSNLLWHGTVHFANNHFIGFSPAQLSSVYYCQSGSSCTWVDDNASSEIFVGTGYSSSNNYAPTSASAATVGKGGNYTSLCNTFSPDNALCFGSTAGVLEQAGEGGMVAVSPTPVARPSSGPWDSGAYEFNATSASQPNPPTGLTAIVQ